MTVLLRVPALTIVLLPLLCLSCGGGGGSTTAPPANRAPQFTSGTSVSTPENSAGTIYSASATDPEGSALSFSISGGADASQFSLAGNGALSFRTAPDFEAPADADRNNSYLVQLSVSDGQASATLDLTVTVTDAADGIIQARRVGTGFAAPLYLTGVPDNSGRVFVVEQAGRIRILDPATGTIAATPFLDIAVTIASSGERGLLGLALAPDFATSGTFYVNVTNLAGDTEIRRYRTGANRDVADPATADVILTYAQPFANHNGGWLDFGPDGFLYIGSGDGGSSGDPQNNAQNTSSLLGKLLRIDVASDAFPGDPNRDYAIPASNPFRTSGGAPEVYAYGLRNPFRASFDRTNGNLFIGDVGQNLIEEIDLVAPNSPGLNFGWARVEGTRSFNGGTAPPGATPPVTEYAHGNGALQGNSVTGGYVYRGPATALQGRYVFGDFVSGNIWSVPVTSLVQGQTFAASGFTVLTESLRPAVGAINNVASFGTDQRGNLYVVDYDGEIYIIEAR